MADDEDELSRKEYDDLHSDCFMDAMADLLKDSFYEAVFEATPESFGEEVEYMGVLGATEEHYLDAPPSWLILTLFGPVMCKNRLLQRGGIDYRTRHKQLRYHGGCRWDGIRERGACRTRAL